MAVVSEPIKLKFGGEIEDTQISIVQKIHSDGFHEKKKKQREKYIMSTKRLIVKRSNRDTLSGNLIISRSNLKIKTTDFYVKVVLKSRRFPSIGFTV